MPDELTLDELTLLMECIDHQQYCWIGKKDELATLLGNVDIAAKFDGMPLPDGLKAQLYDSVRGKRETMIAEIQQEKERLVLLQAKLIHLKDVRIAAQAVERALGGQG